MVKYQIQGENMDTGFYSKPEHSHKNPKITPGLAQIKEVQSQQEVFTRRLLEMRANYREKFHHSPSFSNIKLDAGQIQQIEQQWAPNKEQDLNQVDTLYKALRKLYEPTYTPLTPMLAALLDLHVMETICVLLHQKQTSSASAYYEEIADVNSMAVNDLLEVTDKGKKIEVKRGDKLLIVIDTGARLEKNPGIIQAVEVTVER